MYQKEELMVSSIKKTSCFYSVYEVILIYGSWIKLCLSVRRAVPICCSVYFTRMPSGFTRYVFRRHPRTSQISFSNTVLVTWPLWNVNPRLCGGGHGRWFTVTARSNIELIVYLSLIQLVPLLHALLFMQL